MWPKNWTGILNDFFCSEKNTSQLQEILQVIRSLAKCLRHFLKETHHIFQKKRDENSTCFDHHRAFDASRMGTFNMT